MSTRALTEVILKVWGVIVIGSALTSVGSIAAGLASDAPAGTPSGAFHAILRSNALLVAFGAAVGVLLILIAPWLSRKLFPASADLMLSVSSDLLLNIGIVILGLFQIVEGVLNAARIGVLFWLKPSFDQVPAAVYAWRYNPEALVSAVAALLLGGLLLGLRSWLTTVLLPRSAQSTTSDSISGHSAE
jgi:hypothetical protein